MILARMSDSRRILISSPSTLISVPEYSEEDLVPLDHADRGTLAGIEELAGAYRQHLAALGLLLGRIGQDDAARRLLFRLDLLNHHPVFQGTNCQLCHCLMSFMHEFPKMNRYRL